MSLLLKINEVIIVEGKYDKITLENIIDATFIVTNGFCIYKDKSKQQLIKRLCNEKGAVIITDSDNAGNQIRSYIKNICSGENIINVYLPQIVGKERRKTSPSKQGLLGAEGMNEEIILNALQKSRVIAVKSDYVKITKSDLYSFGLSGSRESKLKRELFCDFVSLPRGMSANAFLDALNAVFTLDEFKRETNKWLQEQDKN